MHGQFLWFSARIEIFLSKNFPPFLNFASLSVVSLSSIQSHIQLAKIFLDESFFFSRETKKQNSIRFQTNFTDYKYFLPAILSINRKIKKKKKRGGNIFIIKEQRTKVKTYCIYDHEVHLFFSTPPLPAPSLSPSFATRTISLPPCFLCILFYSTAPFLLPKIGFPATHFHKTESVLHPQIFIPRGEIARPFWSRQLSKSSRIVCEALYRPAEALTLPPSSHPLSNAFHHPFSILPLLFSSIREFDSSRFYERHEGGEEAENKGDGSMINCESRWNDKRWRVGRGYIENDSAVEFIPCYVCRFWKCI